MTDFKVKIFTNEFYDHPFTSWSVIWRISDMNFNKICGLRDLDRLHHAMSAHYNDIASIYWTDLIKQLVSSGNCGIVSDT